MIIVGLDLSPSSPGCYKLKLDDQFNVVEQDYMGFTTVKKNKHDKIHFYHKTNTFKNYLAQEDWMLDKINDFCEMADYVAIEDYAFNARGRVFHIAEFAGLVKHSVYFNKKKIRLYDPGSIKIMASGRGGCDKITMYESYNNYKGDKSDISHLPLVKKAQGSSPTSDIIDAFYCAQLLRVELTIRSGMKSVRDYGEDIIKIMNRTTLAHPENILSTDFIQLD